MKKRILSCFMALTLVLSMLPSAALAAEPPEEEDETSVVQGEKGSYASVAAALEAGEDTVTLTGNLQEDVVIDEDEKLTLNLGSFVLSEASSHTISNKGTLVIEGTGTVKNTIASVGALANYPSGEVTLNGGTFENTGWYTIKNLGTMTINEGVDVKTTDAGSSLIDTGWYGNTGNDLGLDYTQADTVTLTINGGTFTGGMNTIKNDDYGVLLIKDGTFQNDLGAVVLNWNEATIEGGSFTGNAGSSPVIANSYLDNTADKGQLTIIGGTFTAPENSTLFGYAEGNKPGGTTTVEDGTFNGSIGSGFPYKLDITGGTYDDTDGVQDYLPDGYTTNESGQVIPATDPGEDSVASVMRNGVIQYFDTLPGAIDAAGNGDTVTLLKDVQVEEVISIPEDDDFVLNLGGYTLTLSGTKQVTDAQSGFSSSAALINHGAVGIENGTISFSSASSHGIVNTGSLTVASNATISGTATEYSNTSVIANIGGTLTTAGTLESTANHGIVTYGGTVEVTGGEITAKYTSEDGRNRGSGILIFNRGYDNNSDGANVTISGGTIDCSIYAASTNNTTSGGNDGSNLTITGGTILSDYTAIYWPSSGTLTIGTDGSTTGPTITSTHGSAVEICSGTLNIYGGTLNGGTEMTESDKIETTEDWVEAFRSSSGSSSIGDAVTVISRRGNGYNSAALEVNIEGGTFTSGQNYGLRYMDCNQTTSAAQITQEVSVAVSDGNFSGKIAAVDAAFVAEEDQGIISGGTFSTDVSEYCAPGLVAESNGEGAFSITTDSDMTVQVQSADGAVKGAYASLADAVANAASGDILVLLADQVPTNEITIESGKELTLDLAGHKIIPKNVSIIVKGGLTVKDSSENGKGEIQTGRQIEVDGGSFTLESGKLSFIGLNSGMYIHGNGTAIVNGGEISGTYSPLSGNNTAGDMNIEINGGTITAENGAAIYMPSQGELTITDGTLNGGVSLRMGQVNISGGTINATTSGIDNPGEYYNYSGNVFFPDALYVLNGTYTSGDDNSLSLNITGGTFNCANGEGSAVAIYDLGKVDQDSDVQISDDAILVTNASDRDAYQVLGFHDIGVETPAEGYGDVTLIGQVDTAISGGSFSTPVKEEYCDEGYTPVITKNDDGMYTVTQEDPSGSTVTGLEISKTSLSLTTGSSATLTATTTPSGVEVTWSTSNSSVATVSNGKVVAVGTGSAVITATAGQLTRSCVVTVSAPSNPGGGSSSGSSSSSSGDYLVSVDKTTGGTVRVNPGRADRGDTVTITVKPNSGYELDELVVTDKNGDTIRLTDKGNDKYTFKMPGSKVTVEATFVRITDEPEDLPFVDVPTGAYYYDAVEWAVENGVTNGTSATTFGPDITCTRAQMVTFLWRAAGSPEPESTVNPFADMSASAYYYEAVLWAVERGITNGTSATTFSPDATVTRGQTVTFLWRDAGSPAASGTAFTDVAVGAYYATAVAWAANEGITSGTSATTFSPDAPCTRAQIVTFLYRHMV